MTIFAPSLETPWLVADIGGTNARFGLITTADGHPHDVHTFPCAEHADLAAAIEHFLDRIPPIARPVAACVAAAGPAHGDRFQLTNAHWDFSISSTRRQVGLRQLELINDFTALALAVPQLEPTAFIQIGNGTRWPGDPRVVIGPGTGLGMAGLIHYQDDWVPIPGEGGNVSLPIETDREAEVAHILRRQHNVVSAETVLSGPGLVRLHQALSILHKRTPEPLRPEQVCERGRHNRDPIACETLAMFFGMLGAFAGDAVLTFGARGGVVLGGGILPTIADLLAASDFRRRFVGTRLPAGYLDDVATDLIIAPTPALFGAAAWLRRHQLLQEVV